MNSPELIPSNQQDVIALESIADGIMKTVETEITSSYDIFTDLLSTMEYQSIAELVDTLILRNVEKEWASLTHTEVALLTESRILKEQIHSDLKNMFIRSVRYPTFLQKVIRLQVQQLTLDKLKIGQQDRIIAKEIGIQYTEWQELLEFFGLYKEIGESLIKARTMHVKYADHEQKDILLQVYAPIELEEDIAWVYVHHASTLEIRAFKESIIATQIPVSIIYIEHATLRKMRDVIGGEDIKSKVRDRFRYIPVYKKRSFGDTAPKKEKEAGTLAWNK